MVNLRIAAHERSTRYLTLIYKGAVILLVEMGISLDICGGGGLGVFHRRPSPAMDELEGTPYHVGAGL